MANRLTPTPHSPGDDLDRPRQLEPVLGFVSATAIVVGGVIGSGIFLKPSVIAKSTEGHVGLILTLWFACGLINLCGALTLAELASMMPRAGGTYLFLREAYGRSWSFLWVWAEFWVIRSGSIAALAVALPMTLESLLEATGHPLPAESQASFRTWTATGLVAGLAIINVIGTRWGGAVQNVTTLIKAGFVAFLALLPLAAIGGPSVETGPLFPAWSDRSVWLGVGAALAAIMWAYDGWGMVTVIAEEVKDPARNVPWAMSLGVALITVLYVGANWAYHTILGVPEVVAADIPAQAAVERIIPGYGSSLLLSMLLVSIFGALNSNILVGPRALFAVGRDIRRLAWLERIDPRTGTPAIAILALGGWSIALIFLADLLPSVVYERLPKNFQHLFPLHEKRLFDLLTDYCVFGGSVFYFTAVLAVFVLRRTRPDADRPYRTWAYPIVPIVFVVFYVFLLATMLVGTPWASLGGLAFIFAGLPVFAVLNLPRREGGG